MARSPIRVSDPETPRLPPRRLVDRPHLRALDPLPAARAQPVTGHLRLAGERDGVDLAVEAPAFGLGADRGAVQDDGLDHGLLVLDVVGRAGIVALAGRVQGVAGAAVGRGDVLRDALVAV